MGGKWANCLHLQETLVPLEWRHAVSGAKSPLSERSEFGLFETAFSGLSPFLEELVDEAVNNRPIARDKHSDLVSTGQKKKA